MKNIGCWLLSAVFALILCSCGTKTSTQNGAGEGAEFPAPNYNNDYSMAMTFWGWSDTVFYSWDGFYNGSTSMYSDNRTQLLLSSRWSGFDNHGENYYGDFFVIGDQLYFLTESENKDKAHIYRYNLSSQKHEKFLSTAPLHRWIPTENYIAYTKDTDSSTVFPLYLYNFENGKETLICDTVREFGIVDGKIQYITALEVNALTLHEYDPTTRKTTKLGRFPLLHTDAYIQYNFTPNYTAMIYWISDNATELTVYIMETDTLSTYTTPNPITKFVAGTQYAYAVCYDTEAPNTTTSDENNGIYKIDLSSGSYEKIDEEANSQTQIHVVSDDEIYILQRGGLIRTTTDVYYMNVPEKTKQKLFRQ